MKSFPFAQLCVFSLILSGPAAAFEFGPHEVEILYTPQVQRAVRSGETNANAELDIIGRFRLAAGGDGVWGETRLAFWALGNHTLGGSLSTSAFAQKAGLLWDPNDGDAPDPDWLLGVLALQQDFQTGAVGGQIEIGKLYPGNSLVASPYAGDDRDTFMSQIIASDAAGRWYDRIGLGASVSLRQDQWFATALISDATAQDRLLDVNTLGDGSNLMAMEFGLTPRIAGRDSRVSIMPYVIGKSDGFSQEQGVVVNFTHELGGAADMALFGRYTARTGGEPLTAGARDDARPLRRGGFLGLALNRPFGRENQQVAVAVLQGAASATAQAQGLGAQSGMEAYWKTSLGQHAEFTTGLQVVNRGTRGVEYIPGLRLKLLF